jgi:hypothetical protein
VAVFTRVLAVLLTAFTAMVLFSMGVFATDALGTQQAIAQSSESAASSCPPVTHPHATPERRQCGQLALTGRPAAPVYPTSGQEAILFLAGVLLAGAGGALAGLRLTTPRAKK